jgi:peptidoglycan hydrolase-like protein with peptidoglycan-binding domain
MAKKKIDYTPYILGVGALAAIGFIFKDDIKKLFEPKDTTTDETEEEKTPVIETVVTPAGVITQTQGITKGLSGIGTPKDRLNINQTLRPGDTGQEIAKLQQILNRIAKIYGTATIKEDGNFGSGTESKLTKIYGAPNINLFKAYTMLFAIWNAKNNKDLKNWYKKYFEPYLTDKERYQNARKYYFANNESL